MIWNMKQKMHIYDFQQLDTIWSFSGNIYTGKFNIDEAKMGQSNLLKSLFMKVEN